MRSGSGRRVVSGILSVLALAGLLRLMIASAETAPTLATVLVTGVQPGPGLWKVSNGEHVLWILGTLRPLPQKMSWRSKEVEAVVAQSQEVLGLSRATLGLNLFSSLPELAAWRRIKRLPDGQRLADVLSPDTFARWSSSKRLFLGADDDVERLRPRYAAATLYDAALDHAGLTDAYDIWDVVKRVARKHRVRIVTNDFKIQVDDPRTRIEALEHAPPDADAACMDATLNRLQEDLQNMGLRANAWATGDIETLRKLPYVEQESACLESIGNIEGLAGSVQELRTRLARDWIRSARIALDENRSSVALLPIDEMFSKTGRLAQLRDMGYLVEEPNDAL